VEGRQGRTLAKHPARKAEPEGICSQAARTIRPLFMQAFRHLPNKIPANPGGSLRAAKKPAALVAARPAYRSAD
jgi:hypothetical protein